MSSPTRRYYRGHDLVAMRDVQAGQNRYYHFDHQGSTQCLTDSTGIVTDRFASDAWGVPVKRTGNSINRQWYVGNFGYHDCPQNAWLYVRLRNLFVMRGRWASPDPIRDRDSYRYSDNSPLRMVDPMGLYVVLVRGGQGHPPAMGLLSQYIATTYKEAVLEPTYVWQNIFGTANVFPPGETEVLAVLRQIQAWLNLPAVTSDPCKIRMYGHSWGGHIVGQIAAGSTPAIRKLKADIEARGVKFAWYVTSVGRAHDYPSHFAAVNENLYTLVGDLPLSQKYGEVWDEQGAYSLIHWWDPYYYNTRNLAGSNTYSSGGKDHVIQAPSETLTTYIHISFDGSNVVQRNINGKINNSVTDSAWGLKMREFISRYLMK